MKNERFKWDTKGKAVSENTVVGLNYRFTVLTPQLIRLEYDENGIFEDRASQRFFYRDFPKVDFNWQIEEGNLKIETDDLLLIYNENSPFSKENLSISLKKFPCAVWHFGETADQLKGTAQTLDLADGEVPLEDGLCSGNGYTVIDDSDTALLTDDGWFDIRSEGTQDFYFFGYGHNYLDCIRDFYKITGAPPLLPDYALGNWWSRYYPYTQQEYCDLVERFEKENIPFSVAVVDMDWHTEPQDIEENKFNDKRYKPGWTGYSWNKELFPNYKEFLKFLKKHNLKTSLNLHPAQGIGCHEDMYAEMATAMGIDPKSRKLVKFDCLNRDFMENYFDILHHPYESDGVDFWWMDWQQGNDYWWIHDAEHPADKLEKINPLWLLNHLHILDISRNGKRPMFFSRYSGLGSHRYPVGFSGDTIVTWNSLNFQPYFTANSSNAGYSWWSHDIGGHMGGFRDDEMVIRWMQLGVFSPINRLHSAISKFTGKEPWNLHPYMDGIARKWLRFRHRLFPYIYTMNYRNHTDLIPMILPMYYLNPESDKAYKYPNEYWFGSQLIISPITEKADGCTGLAKTKLWLPKGEWIDAFNGFVYKGEKEYEVYRNIEQMPVFAKAGAIIPTEEFTDDNKMGRKCDMALYVFSGADNTFTMYEDEGDFSNYKEGVWAKTKIDFNWGNTATLKINPPVGECSLLPQKRNWKILFRGFNKPKSIAVKIDGTEQIVDFCYDEKTATITVKLNNVNILDEIEIICKSEDGLLYENNYAMQRIFDILLHAQMGYKNKEYIWERIEAKDFKWLSMDMTEPTHQTLYKAICEMLNL